MCKLTDWFKKLFKREEEIVKDYHMKHTINGKTYDVPDSNMTGKIIINSDGDPEIIYTKQRKVEKT